MLENISIVVFLAFYVRIRNKPLRQLMPVLTCSISSLLMKSVGKYLNCSFSSISHKNKKQTSSIADACTCTISSCLIILLNYTYFGMLSLVDCCLNLTSVWAFRAGGGVLGYEAQLLQIQRGYRVLLFKRDS